MALDGIFLHNTAIEIDKTLEGSRVDKISMPSKESVMITFRSRSGAFKLFINASSNAPRINLTNNNLENPPAPPMFCMLLRKHLSSAKLLKVRSIGLDRIVFLDFEAVNELGDIVYPTLVCEFMGRFSNIILVNNDGIIVDAVKRIDEEKSSVREILPTVKYTLPENRNRLNLFEAETEEIIKKLRLCNDNLLSKNLLNILEGVSPLFCREVSFYVSRGDDILLSNMTDDHFIRLKFYLDKLKSAPLSPYIVYDKAGNPIEFCFCDVLQYGSSYYTKKFESFSLALDEFYFKRESFARQNARSAELLKLLVLFTSRLERKLVALTTDLQNSENREHLRLYGELISANIYKIKKGDKEATVLNYYDNTEITIPLDVTKGPNENSQHYFKLYKKATVAEKTIIEQIEITKTELAYLDTVMDALSRVKTETDILEIRKELQDSGYVRSVFTGKAKNRQIKTSPPLEFTSSDGYKILVGRNNLSNDNLTHKIAKNYDLWLHTKEIPSAHVVIVSKGDKIPDKTITEAAQICAFNSKAKHSSQVPVDYTLIKNVKKIPGAKAGMVIYTDYETCFVTPSEKI